jgi:hypothetical protein
VWTLLDYVTWLEAVARAVASLNALTELSQAVRQVIGLARAHPVGSNLADESEEVEVE